LQLAWSLISLLYCREREQVPPFALRYPNYLGWLAALLELLLLLLTLLLLLLLRQHPLAPGWIAELL
jgi:hypothetical protein